MTTQQFESNSAMVKLWLKRSYQKLENTAANWNELSRKRSKTLMNKTQPKTPDLADDSATQTDSKQRKPSKNRTKAEQIRTQTKRNNEPRSYKLDSVLGQNTNNELTKQISKLYLNSASKNKKKISQQRKRNASERTRFWTDSENMYSATNPARRAKNSTKT